MYIHLNFGNTNKTIFIRNRLISDLITQVPKKKCCLLKFTSELRLEAN